MFTMTGPINQDYLIGESSSPQKASPRAGFTPDIARLDEETVPTTSMSDLDNLIVTESNVSCTKKGNTDYTPSSAKKETRVEESDKTSSTLKHKRRKVSKHSSKNKIYIYNCDAYILYCSIY